MNNATILMQLQFIKPDIIPVVKRFFILLIFFQVSYASYAVINSDKDSSITSSYVEIYFRHKNKKKPKTHNDSLSKASLAKLRFGGTFGMQFGNVIAINIAPSVGYFLTRHLLVGPGIVYEYYKWLGTAYDSHIFGVRLF